MTSSRTIISELTALANPEKAAILSRFFKTGKGQYGEGDCFLGITVPANRAVVKHFRFSVPLDDISAMLKSKWHEIRLAALLLLVEEMKASLSKRNNHIADKKSWRETLVDFYLAHTQYINNWDLVDLSCPYILGAYILYEIKHGNNDAADILFQLAASDNMWEQRIGIVSTLFLIRNNILEHSIALSEQLLDHPHDLIHKAVGWVLREVGKKDIACLRNFLSAHGAEMHRTSLRYAIERMDKDERLYWMKAGATLTRHARQYI